MADTPISATYANSSSFTVASDKAAEFIVGVRVQANCGVDGTKYGVVTSNGTTTVTVTLDSGSLTSNLTGVLHGNDVPASLCNHGHTSRADGGTIAYSSLSGTPTIPAAGSATPAALGTAAAGVAAGLSHEDHVHAMPTAAQVGAATSAHVHTGTYEPANANIQTHISSTVNPHATTASQVGLGNCNNTSDASKPVSTAQQTALDGKVSHSLATAASDFLVASGVGVFVKKTLAETKTVLGLGTAAYTAATDYAVAAKGVTGGDSHDHSGGDGAQIAYSGLSGLPTLPVTGSATPLALGTAAVGVATGSSHEDHVHPTTGLMLTTHAANSVTGFGTEPAAVSTSTSGTAGVATTVSRGDHGHDLGAHTHADAASGGTIAHTALTAIGTNTHATIDTFIGTKDAASGLASLNASSLVVQNPANATATATASKIPIADVSAKLDTWISAASTTVAGKIAISSVVPVALGTAAAGAGTTAAAYNHVHPTTGLMLTSHAANSITGFGTPATIVSSSTSAAAGTATTIARSDHNHNLGTHAHTGATDGGALTGWVKADCSIPFTGGHIPASGAYTGFKFTETGAATNAGKWIYQVDNNQASLLAVNDAETTFNAVWTAERSGATPTYFTVTPPLIASGGIDVDTLNGEDISGGIVNKYLGLSVTSEVSVTGSTTLSASAFGKMHVCTGTTADYTVGLPAASGNAGKLLGIRIGNACTKLVTLDGNASELIDGALTRVMWAGESAILLCDGTGWNKIAGKSIPMICKLTANSTQSIPSGAVTTTRYDVATIDNASIGSLSNYTITTKRAGNYVVVAHASMNGYINWQINLIGGDGVSLTTTNSATVSVAVKSAYFPAGTVFSLSILQSSGSAINTASYPYPYISVQEVISW